MSMECSLFKSTQVNCASIDKAKVNPMWVALEWPTFRSIGSRYWEHPLYSRITWPEFEFPLKLKVMEYFNFGCWHKKAEYLFSRASLAYVGPPEGHFIKWVCFYHGKGPLSHEEFPPGFYVRPWDMRTEFTKELGLRLAIRRTDTEFWTMYQEFLGNLYYRMSEVLSVEVAEASHWSVQEAYSPDFNDPLSGPFTYEELRRGVWKRKSDKEVVWVPPKDFIHPGAWDTDPMLNIEYNAHLTLGIGH